ncbi:peptidoglycan-binding domain-containing protein [Microbacterium kunmingense]|uniref:peptidoglycan-binding domain-containing protein n=1 Tax=Microbacterium kunmingense TaxID=2915939 RepID=UPI003D705414
MRQGVVTSVAVSPGGEVTQGSVLYTVDLRPVVIAAGEVPAFRALQLGSQGPDVAQLQEMLAALGHYAGPTDGRAGAGTDAAIRRWQRSLGVSPTGVVELGDLVFVPRLPTRLSLDANVISRGKTVSPGLEVVQVLADAPQFTVALTETQAGAVPAGTRVEVTSPEGGTWAAVASDQNRDDASGTVTVKLLGADGGTVCGTECGQVPVSGDVLLASRVITVETVTGLVVPSAALTTDSSGATAVVLGQNGARAPVTVQASARGMSVIDGVPEGTRVRVPAASGGAP